MAKKFSTISLLLLEGYHAAYTHIAVLLLTVTLTFLVLLIFLDQRMRFQLFRIYEIVTKLYSSQAYHRHLQKHNYSRYEPQRESYVLDVQ